MEVVNPIMIGQTKSQPHMGNLLIKVGKIQDAKKTTIIFHKISSFFCQHYSVIHPYKIQTELKYL